MPRDVDGWHNPMAATAGHLGISAGIWKSSSLLRRLLAHSNHYTHAFFIEVSEPVI
jgi:hypothetical protein